MSSIDEDKKEEKFRNMMDKFGYEDYKDADFDDFTEALQEGKKESDYGPDYQRIANWGNDINKDRPLLEKYYYSCDECGWKGDAVVKKPDMYDPENPSGSPKEDSKWCPECGEYPQEFEEMKSELNEWDLRMGEPGTEEPEDIDIGGSDYSKDQYDQKWDKMSGEPSSQKYWYTCDDCGTDGKVDLREGSEYNCPECDSANVTFALAGEAGRKTFQLTQKLNEATNGKLGKDFLKEQAEEFSDENKVIKEFTKILETFDENEIPGNKSSEEERKGFSIEVLKRKAEKEGMDFTKDEIREIAEEVEEAAEEEKDEVENKEAPEGITDDDKDTVKEGEKTDKYCSNCGWEGVEKSDSCPQCGTRLRESKKKGGEKLDEKCVDDNCEQSDGTSGSWELRDHETGKQIACYDSKEDCETALAHSNMNESEVKIVKEGMASCPECGSECGPEDKYCSDCGCELDKGKGEGDESSKSVLEEMEECPDCGGDLPGKCEYCPKCGCNLAESIQNMPLEENQDDEWVEISKAIKGMYKEMTPPERMEYFQDFLQENGKRGKERLDNVAKGLEVDSSTTDDATLSKVYRDLKHEIDKTIEDFQLSESKEKESTSSEKSKTESKEKLKDKIDKVKNKVENIL